MPSHVPGGCKITDIRYSTDYLLLCVIQITTLLSSISYLLHPLHRLHVLPLLHFITPSIHLYHGLDDHHLLDANINSNHGQMQEQIDYAYLCRTNL